MLKVKTVKTAEGDGIHPAKDATLIKESSLRLLFWFSTKDSEFVLSQILARAGVPAQNLSHSFLELLLRSYASTLNLIKIMFYLTDLTNEV